jgi:hypothetical protein
MTRPANQLGLGRDWPGSGIGSAKTVGVCEARVLDNCNEDTRPGIRKQDAICCLAPRGGLVRERSNGTYGRKEFDVPDLDRWRM